MCYITHPDCLSIIQLMKNSPKPFGLLEDREKPLPYSRARSLNRVFTRRVAYISSRLDIRILVRYDEIYFFKLPTHMFRRWLWQSFWSTPYPNFSTAIVQTRVAVWQVYVVHIEWAIFFWGSIPSGEEISTNKSWQSGCFESTWYLNLFRQSFREFSCSLKIWNKR